METTENPSGYGYNGDERELANNSMEPVKDTGIKTLSKEINNSGYGS